MAVLLDQDQLQPVQVHLNELTWRVTILFASIALLTAVWVTVVDDVLDSILQSLKPCGGDCLNVYDPAQWSAVRWLTSLLLAVLSALPLIAFHVLQFSKPGLLPSEYTSLRRWMITTASALIVVVFLLVRHGLPALYDAGFSQHNKAGLAAQYSAIDMLLNGAVLSGQPCVVVLGEPCTIKGWKPVIDQHVYDAHQSNSKGKHPRSQRTVFTRQQSGF